MYLLKGILLQARDVEELLNKIRLSIVADNLTYKELDTWMIYQNNLNSNFSGTNHLKFDFIIVDTSDPYEGSMVHAVIEIISLLNLAVSS